MSSSEILIFMSEELNRMIFRKIHHPNILLTTTNGNLLVIRHFTHVTPYITMLNIKVTVKN